MIWTSLATLAKDRPVILYSPGSFRHLVFDRLFRALLSLCCGSFDASCAVPKKLVTNTACSERRYSQS